jgi:DNA-binding helix-hairpin-helix protein with protein kinase domain
MVQFRRLSNNQIITISPAPLYTGGEGVIYNCYESQDLIAKIYKSPSSERAHKLMVMTANPPSDPMMSRGHTSIAWPTDLLRTDDSRAEISGFLMPRIDGARQIFEFYNPQKRRTICPGFDFKYLLRTAKNLVSAISALHDCSYVVGDVNELNILVTNAALVTLIDTDSFQVSDPRTGIIWRCLVGKSDFTPPELQGQNFGNIDRNQQHDLFGL